MNAVQPLRRGGHDRYGARPYRLPAVLGGCLLLLTGPAPRAEMSPAKAAMNQPVAPFRIVGNVYYVGASDVTSYLIETPQGLILLDGGFAETAPQIEKNIAALGFKLSDVKILLNGHAHPDHAGGLPTLQRDTGAALAAMAPEVKPLENSGRGTFYFGERPLYEPMKVHRVLSDGDKVELGGVSLTAHLTAGHTPGCTSWSMRVTDGGVSHDVVFVCQIALPHDTPLVDNETYPEIASDFRRTFAVLRSLPCDVFLAEHGSAYSLQDKLLRLKKGEPRNPFIDPAGYRQHVEQTELAFTDALAAELRTHAGRDE